MTTQSPAPFRITPWVRRLLLANLAVYVLSVTIFVGPWFETTFAFSPLDAASRPWTFLTYGFVHGGLLHLAFNMLMLLFFGPGVERLMGGGAFARYYLLCGLGGPVLAFGLSLVMPVVPFIGASAAVFGVALAFALAWPHARIFVFPVPFPITVKYLVAFLVSMALVPALFGIQDGFDLYANPDPDSETTIALIKPPIVFSANSYSTPLTQPIGLAYLAAVLEKAQYRVQIVDCPGADPDHIRYTPSRRFKVQGLDVGEALSRIDPHSDIIGVTIMFSQEWPFIREFMHRIRERFPRAKIVAGGEHITALPEFSLRDCPAIDYAILGEGELAFLELVHKLRSAQPANEVQGVACRDNGSFRTAQLSPRLAQVEGFPWPAWHLIDTHSYFRPNFTMGISHGRNMAMVATRGCPYQCTFCSSPTMWTTRYVMRPAVDVADEIEHNIQEYGCNSIEFYDLTAIVKKEWVLEFTAELERRNLGITWQLPSGTRSESIDEQVIASIKPCEK